MEVTLRSGPTHKKRRFQRLCMAAVRQGRCPRPSQIVPDARSSCTEDSVCRRRWCTSNWRV